MKKKLVSMLMVVVMLFSTISGNVRAEEGINENPVEIETMIEEPAEAAAGEVETATEEAVKEASEGAEKATVEEASEGAEKEAVEEATEGAEKEAVEEATEGAEKEAVEEASEVVEESKEESEAEEVVEEPAEEVIESVATTVKTDRLLAASEVSAESTITISNVQNAYVVVGSKDGSKNDTLYKTNSNGVICNLDGSVADFDEGTYYIWYGTAGATANRNFYAGKVTVSGGSVSVRLSSTGNSKASSASVITEDQWNWATCVYYNTSTCDHIHIRVDGSYVINIGGTSYKATVSNPSMTVYVNDVYKNSKSWSGTTNYEWTYKTNISLSNEIEVHLKMDLTYTDKSGTHTLKDVEIVYNNMTDRNRWIEFIAICDGIQGFDFTVSVQDIQEVVDYYKVIYQWRVYHLNGSVTEDLPANLNSNGLPASETGLMEGEKYVYNTEYVQGTSYYDYENGLLYTFHGWDTYSHSSAFNVSPTAEGYYALDDGDKDSTNNKKIEITADTWINGYWTVSELEPADAYLMVKKVVNVESGDEIYVKDYLKNIGKMYISIDPGIDQDGDDAALVDVDYPAAVAENGHRIDVYQYETPFIFNEYQADIPGYTRNTVISTSGTNLSLVTDDGTTVTGTKAVVNIEEKYDPEQAPYNLGNVTYTNTYTKNVGTAVSEYPEITIVKTAADTGVYQEGVEFTLYSDAECKDRVAVYTTNSSGLAFVNFEDLEAATYYLKETKALEGYKADESVYVITLSVSDEYEELRWNSEDNKYEYVTVSVYKVDVSIPNGSDAVYTSASDRSYQRLHVYNAPILGSLTIEKKVADTEEYYKDAEYSFTLDCSDNQFDQTFKLKANESYTVENIPWGTTYTVTEDSGDAAFTGVIEDEGEGCIWADKTKVVVTNTYKYNDLTNGIELKLLKTDADDNKKVLEGAGFTLYADEALTEAVSEEVFSDEYGKVVIAISEAGTYYLKETTIPEGYADSNSVYAVTVTEEYVVKNAGTADAVTEIQLNVNVAGLSENSDGTYLVKNTADNDDTHQDDDKNKDEDKDNTGDKRKTPKTGDENNLLGAGANFILSFAALCTTIAIWFFLRRKEER